MTLGLVGEWEVPHVGVTVVGPDGVLDRHGDVERPFRIASVTKLLTAYAVLIATEEGALALDEPAGPPGASVRHLLSHTAGYGFGAGAPVIARPGTRRIYSNRGFDVLAAHLERSTGITFTTYLTEAVLDPLGMTATTLAGSAAFDTVSTVADLGRFAAELLTLPRIDVLANNAGGIFDGPSRTTDGFELTWQVNYLAPYLLTNLLRDTLLASRASVVGTSSIASVLFSRFDPTDPETFDAFSPNRAYGNAKLATNWFAKALHDRFHDRGLSTVAFHPGVIATNFGAESSGILHHAYNLAGDRMFTPAEQGGMNLAYFLTGVPGIHWESGEYYNDKRRPGIQRRAARDRDLIDSVFTETAEVLGVQW